ncbi:MAG: multicopper oxidase domain-containing protein [Chloroflexi bacterium]|nr:multicopper oxidase domain-containing protein [Chloroflexota bacterium]
MDDTPTGSPGPSLLLPRRSVLRGAAVAATGVVAGSVAAACAAPRAAWTFDPRTPTADLAGASPTATPTPAPTDHAVHTVAPATAPPSSPGGLSGHDAEAKAVVERFLAGEWQQIPGYGNQPLAPTIDGDTRVFDMTIDEITHHITATMDPVPALGYNGTWPGPEMRITAGDRMRATYTNNLHESTSVHFHGQSMPNAMDGVPFITQPPIMPGETFSYEFVVGPAGSHMYHSHHNATDQVGRGLLGAFIVDPADPAERYDVKYGATQDIIWISNDAYGGFTINGRQFPATAPLVAQLGEVIVIRFMNEGVMMHPWHLHGMPMRVVARDGYPLGSAEFTCDTLGVNPGERFDVVITCDNPGAWAFHCHILPHAEGPRGMFGMVTALIVQ